MGPWLLASQNLEMALSGYKSTRAIGEYMSTYVRPILGGGDGCSVFVIGWLCVRRGYSECTCRRQVTAACAVYCPYQLLLQKGLVQRLAMDVHICRFDLAEVWDTSILPLQRIAIVPDGHLLQAIFCVLYV